ncbi:BtpA/SgcQ family protein [Thermus tengchongensis]|uniref:BtpA/SgcQ family protein n=1 Tax=Thermus tengchongensis TaxID=1214928 RepID=UPI00056F947E|nr:BtpA/SgcQ family protein [Thermus tengchongensis]
MERFEALFGHKPVIAMVHLRALPGTPLYDGDLEGIVEAARQDLLALQAAGVDAVMFGNENDRPYELQVDPASTATMAYVIGRLKGEIRVPFGVDVLWDPMATMALAAATGARFAREIFTGLYGSDMGLWQGRAAEALRYRRRLGRDDLFLLYNVSAEFASPLDSRSLPERAKSAVFSSLADAVLVSGPMTGEGVALEHLVAVKEALPGVPVLANTGVRHDTVAEILRVADGVIVGTALKREGITWNPVDPERARAFMETVRQARGR